MRRRLLGLAPQRKGLTVNGITPTSVEIPPFWSQANVFDSASWSLTGDERIANDFQGYIEGAYKNNGIVFACILARLLVFSEARFQFQQMNGGRPGDLFGNPQLSLLETPWRNGTTGDLLARMEQDSSLAGNFFAARVGGPSGYLRRLSPERVTIIAGSPSGDTNPHAFDLQLLGYSYLEANDKQPVILTPDEVVHFAPIPDPARQFRGMSWLTPVVREIVSDTAATTHKQRFFENGAVPSTVIVYDKSVDPAKLPEFAAAFRASHAGTDNAYKTLHLAGGADIKSYGADLKQLDFKTVQGAGETRIAAAAGVGAIIGQFSEGLAGSSLNAGNYAAARRRFADMTMRPLWRSAAAALAPIVTVPSGARLWFDDRDIPFLQEDRKDAADIQQTQATTVQTLVNAGYEPESAVKAVMAEDLSLLVHTGRLSVQLQDPSKSPELTE